MHIWIVYIYKYLTKGNCTKKQSKNHVQHANGGTYFGYWFCWSWALGTVPPYEIWNLLLMTTKGTLAQQSNELLSRLCWDPCKEHYLTEFFRLWIMLQPGSRRKNDRIFQNNFRMCGIISELTTTQYKEKDICGFICHHKGTHCRTTLWLLEHLQC